MTDIREQITTLANRHDCNDCQDAAITMDKMLAVIEAVQDVYSSDVPFDSSKSTPVFWSPGVKLQEALAALEQE